IRPLTPLIKTNSVSSHKVRKAVSCFPPFVIIPAWISPVWIKNAPAFPMTKYATGPNYPVVVASPETPVLTHLNNNNDDYCISLGGRTTQIQQLPKNHVKMCLPDC